MKVKAVFGIFLSLFFAFLVVSTTHALSGPTGLNYIRTEAGPGAGQITLNWQRYNSDVTGYMIQYGTAPGKYQYSTVLLGNVATTTIGYLTPGIRYYFRLIPFRNNAQANPVSPEVSDVATSAPHTVVGTSGPYGQRHLMAVSGPGIGQVTLTWQRLYPGGDTYHITYGLQPGKYIYGAQNIGSAPNGNNSFTVGALASGVRYYFAVVPSHGGVSIYDSAEVSTVAR
jgi:hypothetical protein